MNKDIVVVAIYWNKHSWEDRSWAWTWIQHVVCSVGHFEFLFRYTWNSLMRVSGIDQIWRLHSIRYEATTVLHSVNYRPVSLLSISNRSFDLSDMMNSIHLNLFSLRVIDDGRGTMNLRVKSARVSHGERRETKKYVQYARFGYLSSDGTACRKIS